MLGVNEWYYVLILLFIGVKMNVIKVIDNL